MDYFGQQLVQATTEKKDCKKGNWSIITKCGYMHTNKVLEHSLKHVPKNRLNAKFPVPGTMMMT